MSAAILQGLPATALVFDTDFWTDLPARQYII